jgi:hypothetical protein
LLVIECEQQQRGREEPKLGGNSRADLVACAGLSLSLAWYRGTLTLIKACGGFGSLRPKTNRVDLRNARVGIFDHCRELA